MAERVIGETMTRKMHPNSLKNLKPQKKGEPCPHAKGRPLKGKSITSKQREMLPLPCPYAPGKTWLEWLAERGMALSGDNAQYYKELMDRLEGKVTQTVEGQLDVKVNWVIGKGYSDADSHD